MTNIMVLDDIQSNLDVMELLIEEYMDEKEIENYKLFLLNDSTKAIDLVKQESIDILFLDIMMQKLDGFDILKMVREDTSIKQPIIVMATALGDDTTKQKEAQLGANAYMVKPIRYRVVKMMLDRYLQILKNNTFEIDDQFDFDDFDDFDDFETVLDSKQEFAKSIVNRSYEPLNSVDFMENHNWHKEDIHFDLEDIESLLFRVFETREDEVNLRLEIENILKIFSEFNNFLTKFEEFIDLSILVSYIMSMLQNVDIDNLTDEKLKIAGAIIKAIIFDLEDFKIRVFDEQSANNIYYLNASIASSYLQVRSYFD